MAFKQSSNLRRNLQFPGKKACQYESEAAGRVSRAPVFVENCRPHLLEGSCLVLAIRETGVNKLCSGWLSNVIHKIL
jgi:hypothetical protein